MPIFENGVYTLRTGQEYKVLKRISIPSENDVGGYLNPGTTVMCVQGGTAPERENVWSVPHLRFKIIEPKCDLQIRERAARGLTVVWNWNVAVLGFLDTVGPVNPMLEFMKHNTR